MSSPQPPGSTDPRGTQGSTGVTQADPVAPGWPSGRPPAEAGHRPDAPPGRAGADAASAPTTVLPSAPANAGLRRPVARPGTEAREPAAARPAGGRTPGRRRTRLAVQRLDPWSVFLYSLVASLFLGLALVVAVAVLYAVLSRLGVTETVNELVTELTGGDAEAAPLLTTGRFVGGAAVLAAVNVVLLTLLATLSALLYNLCASFTGGIEVTLGERDS